MSTAETLVSLITEPLALLIGALAAAVASVQAARVGTRTRKELGSDHMTLGQKLDGVNNTLRMLADDIRDVRADTRANAELWARHVQHHLDNEGNWDDNHHPGRRAADG